MLKNYWKITIRNLLKNKVYALINILGLAIGLAGFIIISTYIKNELSFDRFHKNANRIYRPVEIQHHPGVGTQHVAVTMGPLAPALANDFPEILSAARIRPHGNFLLSYGDKRFYEEAAAADPAIFEIFTIPFSSGDPATALAAPNSMVLTRTLAEKYFGDANPLGEMISYGPYECQVTGVIDDYPENSHLHFEMLLSFSTIENEYSWLNSWHSNSMATYILLREGASAQALEAKFPEFLNKYIEEEKLTFELYLQPLLDVHLRSDHIIYQTYNYHRGDIQSVYIFSLIALFILLIACINYMNLATARSLGRAREVGVKKVVGARPIQLIRQFLVESILLAFLALLASQLLMELAQPLMTQLTGKPVALIFSPQLLLLMVLVTLLAGLFAGCYPAFFIAAFKPVEVLKGAFKSTAAGISLRQALVVFQFVIATVLLAGMGVINAQMDFIRSKDLGFKRDALVTLDVNGYAEVQRGMEAFRNDLLANSTVEGVTTSRGLIVNGLSNGHIETVDNAGAAISSSMYRLEVGLEYLSVYGINLLAGRDFDPAIPTDTAEAFIVNRAAVEMLGWGDPAQAIGKPFKRGNMSGRVIGVARDFHFASLHKPVEPVSISLTSPRRFSRITLRIRSERLAETLTFIRQTWQTHFPEALYQLNFMNDRLNQQYRQEQQFRDIFQMFVVISLIIAGLGLFGLASYAVTQRVKEIGIRKVLGAPVSRIILLVSRDFLKLVILACIIACPLAYWIMNRWLQDFAYRAEIGPGVFLLAAAAAIVVAALTISYQSIRAALADPVKALRSE